MNISKIVPSINKYIKDDVNYILPSDNAHDGLCVPQLVFDYGDVKHKIMSIPNVGKYMAGCVKELKKTYRSLYNQPINAKKEISQSDLNNLRELLTENYIDDISYAKVDTSYIFNNSKILYENAIVLVTHMDKEAIATAPSKQAEKEIFKTYYYMNAAANKAKEFLNSRGYNAQAGPALGGEVNYPLLAQKAGLGAIGKHGLLITPKYGPSIRLAAIYTDIQNLPLVSTNEHMWINDFCEQCNICIRKCPAKAIYKSAKIFPDGSKECIDYKKCALPFSTNRGCTVCVKECTLFINDYEKIKKGFVSK